MRARRAASLTALTTASLLAAAMLLAGCGGGGSSLARTFTIKLASQTCPPPSSTSATAKDAVTSQAVAEQTPAVSLDGRYVAYTAAESEHTQIFARDTCEGAAADCRPHTTLISAALDGTSGDGDSQTPSISSDGRYVAFSSAATNLIANSPPGRQIYLRDTCAAVTSACAPSTQLVSVDPNGALTGTESILPSVSSSGRFVAFLAVTVSHASDAVSATNSGYREVFVRDTCLGAASCTPKTTRLSLQPNDTTGTKPAGPAVTGNGKDVAATGAGAATLFTRALTIDDRIFLAATQNSN